MPAVADSSALIWLAKAGRLDLLRDQYGEVSIPREVYREAVEQGLAEGYSDAHAISEAIQSGWMTIEETPDSPRMKRLMADAREIGAGEAASILLASETHRQLIIDDADGRSLAQTLGLRPKGTIHVLLTATRRNKLTRAEAAEALALMVEKGFRIDPSTLSRVLAELNAP
jgi:hypothetical protein